jgi:Ca-activated chloride channel homolog
MKYLRAGIAAAALIAFGALWFRVARAQQDPGSDSSETVAKPRKKPPSYDTPPPDTSTDTPATDSAAPPPAPAPAPPPAADSNTAPAANDDSSDEPKIPSKFSRKGKEAAGPDTPTFSSDVTTVDLDVAVLDNKGQFLPGIPKSNFRVLEDNVPQQIATFNMNSDAPMTIAMVIEFNALFQQFWSEGWYETLAATYTFVQTLRPQDYVAVVAYDLRPEILCDFTNDQGKLQYALERLRIPGFSESSMFDAVVDTEQRMANIPGRKAILLIASGRDTLSKLTWDKARKAIQEAGVPIYAFSLLQALRIMAEPYMGNIQYMDFLQADNEMRTMAAETGGKAFFPRFLQEYPSIFQNIGAYLRNQYSLTYRPSNQTKDGTFRKIKVELVDPKTGEQLRITEKGKPVKYTIVTKDGYTAPRPVE